VPKAPRQPQRRPTTPDEEDRPIDPDAAFGDDGTDLEPPAGELAEERTD
jgi:hypothetical protein